jgi:hypothetical protein
MTLTEEAAREKNTAWSLSAGVANIASARRRPRAVLLVMGVGLYGCGGQGRDGGIGRFPAQDLGGRRRFHLFWWQALG